MKISWSNNINIKYKHINYHHPRVITPIAHPQGSKLQVLDHHFRK